MDEYDYKHNSNYNDVMNVYHNSNIDETIQKFFNESELELTNYLTKEITNQIEKIRAGFNILDSRYITNIGVRICVPTGENKKWILVQVWKGCIPK